MWRAFFVFGHIRTAFYMRAREYTWLFVGTFPAIFPRMTIPAFTIIRNGRISASVAYVPHAQKGCAPRTILTIARHATRADVSEILRELATQETAHVVIEGVGEIADVYPNNDDATRWILFVDGKGIRTLDRAATVDALFALI